MNREQATLPPDTPQSSSVRVVLFDAEGEDRMIAPESLDPARLAKHELAWIDLCADEANGVYEALAPFGLEALPIAPLFDPRHAPVLSQQDWFGVRALAPVWNKRVECHAAPWLLLVGPNIVVTVRREAIAFLDEVAALEDPDSRIGKLGADSFATALLDRLLTAYFEAIDAFEDRLDHLEVEILKPRVRTAHLPELRRLRHIVALLRRMLSSHRDLFDAIARPDFQPDQDPKVEAQFQAVSARYERAMDAVENARDLVIGSYELLSTRLSQRTNDSMRLLTFVTVMLGSLAVVAGVLGMNFQAALFKTGSTGFWVTVGAMTGFALLAMIVARLRGWWR